MAAFIFLIRYIPLINKIFKHESPLLIKEAPTDLGLKICPRIAILWKNVMINHWPFHEPNLEVFLGRNLKRYGPHFQGPDCLNLFGGTAIPLISRINHGKTVGEIMLKPF